VVQIDTPEEDSRAEVAGQARLRDLMRDPGLDPHARAGAVRAYFRAAAANALPDLREALASPQERVAAAAAAALGQIGGPDDLPALRELRNRVPGALSRRQVSFAEALIVHRHGLADHDIELPEASAQAMANTVGSLPLVSVQPGKERRARALEGIRREFPWLDPARQDVYELACGPRLLEVAVDAELGRSSGWAALAQRPALAAIVAFQSVEHDWFSAALLALSRPTGGDRVELVVTRLGGEPAYIGEGTMTAGEPVFDLRTAYGPGSVPVMARIRLTAGGVEIAGVSDRRGAPAQAPERVDPPA
jgi:hypothetical protein